MSSGSGNRFRLTVLLAAALLVAVGEAGGDPESGGITSLSGDPQGWALHPVIASGPDGALYAAWAQHLRPDKSEYVGIYVQQAATPAWKSLGGRIGHRVGESGAKWPEAHGPSIAVLNGVPYVAWYEGGGYGWGDASNSAVFVAHWDGGQWTRDRSAGIANGALNTASHRAARDPSLAVVGGALHAAWLETVAAEGSGTFNHVAVKRLTQGQWMDVGRPFRGVTGNSRIMGLALTDVDGSPCVAWSEIPLGSRGERAVLNVSKFEGTDWKKIGRSLNTARDGYANFVAIAAAGSIPYVAWQERSVVGNSQIYVKAWQGGTWTPAGGSLNIDPARGEAGRPALVADGQRLWLAWTEGSRGERAKLYARSLTTAGWSAPLGPLNSDVSAGAPDTPGLAAIPNGVALVWAEKGLPPSMKRVFVRILK